MSVTPFSGPKYTENSDKCQDPEVESPCVICGRPIKRGKEAGWLRVVDGGMRFASGLEEVDSSGDMGYWPIGKTCLKNHKELKEIIEHC